MAGLNLRKCAAALVMGLAALGGCTYWSGDFDRLVDESGRDFSRDPARNFRSVEFEKIVKHPASYMLMDVKFLAILNRQTESVFLTMYSTFREEDYLAFSLWPMGARVWEEWDRTHSIPTIYIRKDNPDIQKIIDAPRYSVVQCCGRVMGDFDSGDQGWGRLPFIDVVRFDVTLGGAEYDDESIKLMAEGLENLALRRPAPAKEKLSKAVQGTLGMGARALALAKLGLIYEEAGQFEVAIDHYALALDADPENAEAKEGLERAQKAHERKLLIQEGAAPK